MQDIVKDVKEFLENKFQAKFEEKKSDKGIHTLEHHNFMTNFEVQVSFSESKDSLKRTIIIRMFLGKKKKMDPNLKQKLINYLNQLNWELFYGRFFLFDKEDESIIYLRGDFPAVTKTRDIDFTQFDHFISVLVQMCRQNVPKLNEFLSYYSRQFANGTTQDGVLSF